uniref:Uncharacterized protein n=1 Tax=Solanum tuberosum TaxID=4113 RepID=M1E0K9_SOLTU
MKGDKILQKEEGHNLNQVTKERGSGPYLTKQLLDPKLLYLSLMMISLSIPGSLRGKSHTTSNRVPSASTLANSMPVHAPPMAPLPPVVSLPRLLNRLKEDVLRTILEEKLLPIEGLERKYPDVWDTLSHHHFEQFTSPRGHYISSWVREFYAAYGDLVPKSEKKASEFRPVN